ncbi:MAG: hypothetical protein ABSB35_17085 [Bryobacteraceae bacterium]|jgi:hypothetical protein
MVRAHVEFSANQKLLAVQDWENIRVVSLSNFQIVRTLASKSNELRVPFSILSAGKNDLFLVSYGKSGSSKITAYNDLMNPPVHNELVSLSTGQIQSSWESMDIPQSLSPDGKLAALSDWETSTILVEVEIVDITHISDGALRVLVVGTSSVALTRTKHSVIFLTLQRTTGPTRHRITSI